MLGPMLGPNSKVVLTTLPPDAQVLFNIGGPALNQLNDTAQKNKLQAKRSVAAGLGLTAASLLAAQSADAAEIAQVMLHHCSRTSVCLSVLSKNRNGLLSTALLDLGLWHAQVAAGDNRIGAILLLFAPVVGWVSVQLACITGCCVSWVRTYLQAPVTP